MNLKNKIAIITGATGELGSAFAVALAQGGCYCICHYNKNKSKAEQLIAEIRRYSTNATAIQADLTKPEDIERLFKKAQQFGTPQILINSAAIFEDTPLKNVTQQQAQRFFDTNAIAAILTSKKLAANFKDKNSVDVWGKIINIADVAGIHPWSEYSLYCASKAAIIGATKSLAKELAPHILVNAIAPGIATWPEKMTPEEEKRQLSFIPMGRFAETKEIAAAMIFLLENDYITGQTLIVAGGRAI